VKTYNPKKTITTFLGVPLTGYADGTFVTVDKAADAYSLTIGGDGEGARAQSADESGTVKVVLLQTSASNDFLANALRKDKLTGVGYGPLMVKDVSGRSIALAAEAWVQKEATVEFGKEIVGREWTLASANLDHYVGGN
jgi:hypothetical protein